MTSIGQLPALIMSLVVVGLLAGVGLLVLGQFYSIASNPNGLNNSVAAEFLQVLMQSFGTLAQFLPIIVIAILGFVVIGLVYSGGRTQG